MHRPQTQDALSILQEHIGRRYKDGTPPGTWRSLPEIPSKEEIMPKPDNDRRQTYEEWDDYQKDPVYDPDLPVNIVDGAWSSTIEYLGAHYRILREDAIAPLRRSVDYFRQHQQMRDNEDTYVYNDVHVKGLNLGAIGPAFRITFSTQRSGKRIRWEQSKRLQQGTMVALSPERDMFGSICKVAIVAARPLSGLEEDPPEIDIFWGNTSEVVVDPSETYVMLEARVGYFEAYRHMLVALQKLPHERFLLQNHLVALDDRISAPNYLVEDPLMNLSSLTRQKDDPDGMYDDESLNGVDILGSFPIVQNTTMDTSQMAACKSMLTKRLAMVQGPPGTGKTFTSVAALRALIQNVEAGRPPIIIAAQTNHALDQLLNHVLEFEPGVVRLGGRTSFENDVIRSRTLYELRMVHGKEVPNGGQGLRRSRADLQGVINAIKDVLSPLLSGELLTDQLLRQHALINERQQASLYERGWSTSEGCCQSVQADKRIAIQEWLTPSQLMPVLCTPQVNLGFQMEECDGDLDENPEEDTALEEKGYKDEDKNDMDAMLGEVVLFQRKYTGVSLAAIESRKITGLLKKHNNLYEIPVGMRGAVYRYWEKKIDKEIRADMRSLLLTYTTCVRNTKIAKFMCNIRLIHHLGIKVIGCTTTGLSKYRALLSALNPRTLLVEEAAETLEGTIIAGMFDSLEHLILVGDHKQLQAHCSVQALEVEPYYLNISMFERLVKNGIPYTMLSEQRRMITDIRKLLCIEPEPFYKGLSDHPSVLDRRINRPSIPGMGGRDVWFFHHNWPESKTPDLSIVNHDEAEMIAGFFNYLLLNGTNIKNITILSFYNGQKKRILQELKKHPNLGPSNRYNVHTVDSYQGEENDIILLSLVRSNTYLSVGFLESQNRLVVALSRARRGLYLFGNAVTLTGAEASRDGMMGIGRDPLWGPLTKHMRLNGQLNIDMGMPITCQQHGVTVSISNADDWFTISAGCKRECTSIMECGHPCPLSCHPFNHGHVICQTPCAKLVPGCQHSCSEICGKRCRCEMCDGDEPSRLFIANPMIDSYETGNFAKTKSVGTWAESDLMRIKNHDGEARASKSQKSSSQQKNYFALGGLQLHKSTPDWRSPAQRNSRDECPLFAGPELVNPHASISNLLGGYISPYQARETSISYLSSHDKQGSLASRNPLDAHSAQLGIIDVSNDVNVIRHGSTDNWKSWNAKQADQKLLLDIAASGAIIPKLGHRKMVYNETFRRTAFKDGKRAKGGVVRNVIGGVEHDSALKPVLPPFQQAVLLPINNAAADVTGMRQLDEDELSFKTTFASMRLTSNASDLFVASSAVGDLIDFGMENSGTTKDLQSGGTAEVKDDDEEQLIQF